MKLHSLDTLSLIFFKSGGIPLICVPIYKMENEKWKMTVFLFVFCKHLKQKRKYQLFLIIDLYGYLLEIGFLWFFSLSFCTN